MRKRLISIAVVLSIIASLFIVNMYSSAATEDDVDNYKYVPKIVQVGANNKMIFDSELARISHKMALDTYKIRYDSNAQDIATTMKAEGFTDIQQNHQFDDYFMGMFSNNFLVGAKTFTVDGKEKHVVAVAFRGTTVDGFDYGDLFTDASVIGMNGFHSGFYLAANQAFNTLCEIKFPSLKNDDGSVMSFANVVAKSGVVGSDYSIVVTGHSLGGAVANIFTGEILGQISQSNIVCYTFASPKVCSTETASTRDAYNVFNIINTKDIVPDVGYNIFAGTRLGNDFRVTVSDSEENSHNLNVTYSKALEQVISNIDSHYPYIHRICYDKTENDNVVKKDETHIHTACTLSKRYGLNFIVPGDLILYSNVTLDQTDLNLNNLIVNNVTLNAPDNKISVNDLQISGGNINSEVFVSGNIISSGGTITTLNISGSGSQNLEGTLNATNLVYNNTGTVKQSGTIYVSGTVKNTSSKVTNGQNTVLKSTGSIIGDHYNGGLALDGVTLDKAISFSGTLKTLNTVNLDDVSITGDLTQSSGTLTLNGDVSISGDSYFAGTVKQNENNYYASGDISVNSTNSFNSITTKGKLLQTLTGTINVTNFTNTNTKGISVSNKLNVSGTLTNNGKISGMGITLLSGGNFGNSDLYDGDITIQSTCDIPSKLTGNVVISATNTIKQDTDVGGYLTANSGSIRLENTRLNVKGKVTLSIPLTGDGKSSLNASDVLQNNSTIKNCLISVNKEFVNSGTVSGGSITTPHDIYNNGTIDIDDLSLKSASLIEVSGNSISTDNLTLNGTGKINLKTNINVADTYTNNGVKVDDTKIIISSGRLITSDKTYSTLNQTTDLIIDGCTVVVDIANITAGIKLINGAKLVINKRLTASASSKTIDIDETSALTINKIASISSYSNIVVNGELTLGSDVAFSSTKLSGSGTINIKGDLYGSSLTINKPETVNIIGKTPQVVSCSGANFNNLYISNNSRKGVTFSSSVNCYGEYNTNDSNISGTVTQK